MLNLVVRKEIAGL